MQRRPLNKSVPLVLLASGVAVVLAASACSDTPASPSPGTSGTNPGTSGTNPGTSGTGGAATTAGTGTTGGSAITAGTGTGGTGVMPTAGTGGMPIGGTSGGVGGGGGGTAPAGGSGPTCKAVTPINGSGLTVSATDISAFKLAATPPAGNLTKMAWDPVGKVIVVLGKDGKMWSSPEPTIPTTMTTTSLATFAPYTAGGYAPVNGYGDHRGIVFGPDGTLYVLAAQGGANVGVAIRKGVPGAGGARTWTDLVTTNGGFPQGGTNFDHSFSGIAISKDGANLYFSSGSRTDHGEMEAGQGEVPLSSAVFKVPTATPTVLKNDMATLAPVLFADGTRNSFDMAFNANDDLIAAENGPDMDLPDEINFLQQGKHYGFPFRFGNVNNPVAAEAAYTATGDKRLHGGYQAVDNGKYVADPTLAPPAGQAFVDPISNMGPDANMARADRNAEPAAVVGLAGITGHRSPLGIVFDTAGALCGPYYKQGLVLSYGSVLPSALGDGGNDLLLLNLTKAGDTYTMTAKQVAKGIVTPMDAVLVGNKMYTVGFNNAPMYVFVLPTP